MNDQELKQLAMDIVDGKVYGSWDISQFDLLGHVFMPLMFMGKDQIPKDAVHLCEYIDKAEQRSINGMPIFMSCKFIIKTEHEKLQEYVDKIVKAKEKMMESL